MKTEQQVKQMLLEMRTEIDLVRKTLFEELNKNVSDRDTNLCNKCFDWINNDLTIIMVLNKILGNYD